MTPEELEAIPGIGPKMVERIQAAVVNYYGQFEVAVEGAEVSGEALPEAAPVEPEPPLEAEMEPELGAVPDEPEARSESEAASPGAGNPPEIESDRMGGRGQTEL
jgi:hypothetical protein